MIKNRWIWFKRFVLPYPAAFFVKYLFRALLFTCRYEVEGLESFVSLAQSQACILALWHNRLGIMPEFLNKFCSGLVFSALVSKSRDGEPLARIINSYARGETIRVSHNDRHGALHLLIAFLKKNKGVAVLTPDGPRGPRYQLKPGIAAAARATSAPVVLVTWMASRSWSLKTWDKFMIPKPFSTIKMDFSDPFKFSDQDSVEEIVATLQEAMLKHT